MTHIQQRRDTFANWTLINPVLMEGEAGHETNTGRWKLGDGITPYVDLPYKQAVDSVAGKTGAVSLVVADVTGAAPLADPVFTGAPTAPTPATSNNTTRIATTEWVKNQAYAAKDSPSFLGNPTAPTPATADNDTSLATTAWVRDFLRNGDPVLDAGSTLLASPPVADNAKSIATTEWVKSAVGLWQSYTPTMGGASAGNGTWDAGYTMIGKTVNWYARFTLGTTSSISTVPSISLPVPAYSAIAHSSMRATFTDTGTSNYEAAPAANGTVGMLAYVKSGTYAAYGGVGPSTPFVWTAGDLIEMCGTYRAA